MIEQLDKYLKELDGRFENIENGLMNDAIDFSDVEYEWNSILVLRGERVAHHDYTEVFFNHNTSGHGKK